jgi:hypothetical protein
METIPLNFTLTFLALVAATLFALVAVFKKTVAGSSAKNKYLPLALAGVLWLAYSLLAAKGLFLDSIKNTPPAFMPAVISTALLAAYFALAYKPLQQFNEEGMKYAVAIQTFRLPLELLFAWALALGAMPQQMTFEGRNFDVLVGITAPFVAYFGYVKPVLPKWFLIAWNFAGLALLVNIVTIAILSAPTNFQVFTNEPHNTIVLTFPYTFIPFFFVPLALFGHLFALKRLFVKQQN